MEEIISYLKNNGIKANIEVTLNFEPKIKIEYFDFSIVVIVNKETTLEQFKELANSELIKAIEARKKYQESLVETYRRQIEKYTKTPAFY